MTIDEFNEINKKYKFSMMFNDRLKSTTKEDYEELVKSLVDVIEDIINDNSDEEDGV